MKSHQAILLAGLLATLLAGCDGTRDAGIENEREATDVSVSATDQLRAAVRLQRWKVAAEHVRSALIENPGDPAILRLAADVSFANQKPADAALFTVQASEADGFRDEALVERAVLGCIGTGRLFQLIEFLEQVVESFPERHESRRLLFDFLVNVEDQQRALPHGRILVRERQFDRVLLFSLCTYEQRDLEAQSMVELCKRNPEDPRLEIAEIRAKMDLGRWEGVENDLKAILQYSSNNVPAQLLMGQYFQGTNQMEKLSAWVEAQPESMKSRWKYWSLVGDLAIHRNDIVGAVRGYAEAVEINSDVGEVMAKLARSLKQMQLRGDQSAPEGLLEAVTRRAELLNRFGQEKERFYKLGNRSNEVLAMMAKTLFELGRLWEAEAWAALAFTMPDDDLGDVKKVREQIVGLLRSETPWQLSLGDAIETMDWKQFGLPKLERLDVIAGTVERDAIRPSVMPKLVDEAVKRGIRAHLNNAADAAQFQGIPLYAQMESGGCALDFDLDGWQDLYVAEAGGTPGRGNSGKNHLFRNLRGTFVETTASGTRDDGFAQGVTFGDVNEDGFPDLVVLNYGVDCLFLNNGDGTFTKRNDWFEGDDRKGQPATAPWSTSAAIADIDGDGISDFFCAKYTDGMDAVDVACFDENDIENPCLPTKFAAARDEFYRGNQDGRLERVTDQWHAIPSQLGRGLGVVVGNLDGRPGNDLFVANDMTTNQFWSMENASRLTDSATLRGLGVDGRFRPQACMGIATADFDTDGDIDLFVTNFEQEHNTIYEQQDAGIWADRTVQFGLMKTSFSQLGFGTQAIDFDNDSQLEIAVANGHVYQDAEPPSTYEQQMQILYRNSSKGFAAYEIPQGDDYVGKSHVGRAMWTVDVNRDGKQDLAVTHQTEPVALLVNHTPSDNGWIELSLVGLSDARDAIGATVTAEFDGESRLKPLLSGDGFYCASQRVVHFGLGESGSDQDEIDVTIRWPDDTEESFQLSANRRYRIVQGLGEAFEME